MMSEPRKDARDIVRNDRLARGGATKRDVCRTVSGCTNNSPPMTAHSPSITPSRSHAESRGAATENALRGPAGIPGAPCTLLRRSSLTGPMTSCTSRSKRSLVDGGSQRILSLTPSPPRAVLGNLAAASLRPDPAHVIRSHRCLEAHGAAPQALSPRGASRGVRRSAASRDAASRYRVEQRRDRGYGMRVVDTPPLQPTRTDSRHDGLTTVTRRVATSRRQ